MPLRKPQGSILISAPTNPKNTPPSMNNSNTGIELKPSPIFAFIKITPFILCTIASMYIANRYISGLLWISLLCVLAAIYRYIFIRQVIYLVTTEYIRVSKGIFFRQIDTVELFRIKDYTIIEPFLLQL